MMMVALNEGSTWLDEMEEGETDARCHRGNARPQLRERNSLAKFNTSQRFSRKPSRKTGGPSGARRKLYKRSGL
ncbi:MAG: hypothetical protein KDA42_01180 [Planctomycetales bacterium]|nr:hypothetical protein [Planctomycetales bacterium]